MWERRIQLDLDDEGYLCGACVETFGRDGKRTGLLVHPTGELRSSELSRVLEVLLEYEPPTQLDLPLPWARWLRQNSTFSGETPIPDRF